MFKTEKSARYGLIGLMALLGVFLPVFFAKSMYGDACMTLGIELIFCWAYLNPWILLEKYRLFLHLDTRKMVHNRVLAVGGLIFVASLALIFNP